MFRAAQQQRDAGLDVLLLQSRSQVVAHLADRQADQLGGAEHAGGVGEGLQFAGVRIDQPFLEDAQGRLGHRQVARGRHRQHPLARRLVDVQLAIGGNVVEARVGAGVGEHHESFLDEDTGAIGHVVSQTSVGAVRRHAYD